MQVTPFQIFHPPVTLVANAPKSGLVGSTNLNLSPVSSTNKDSSSVSIQGNLPQPVIYNRPNLVDSQERQSASDSQAKTIEKSLAPDVSPKENGPAGGIDSQERSDESRPLIEQNNGRSSSNGSPAGLSDQQREQVTKLSIRDQSVRAHEQAHKSVGGQYAGSISLSYQTGPDGRRYAIGGEVPIDVSPIPGDPQATIAKMRTVKAAANAPADPSTQDRKVAIAASRILSRAQIELSAQKLADITNSTVNNSNNDRLADAVKGYREIIGLASPAHSVVDAFA